jgi:Family of unknown function (DUF6152)
MKSKFMKFALAALIAALPVAAHHSFAAEYDASKPVTIKGKFVKMDWINPHSWVHLEVTGEDGKAAQWKAEALPPNGLYRQGWRKDTLKAGEEISVEGFMAKDGSNTMWSRAVTRANGQRMFAGAAQNAENK